VQLAHVSHGVPEPIVPNIGSEVESEISLLAEVPTEVLPVMPNILPATTAVVCGRDRGGCQHGARYDQKSACAKYVPVHGVLLFPELTGSDVRN